MNFNGDEEVWLVEREVTLEGGLLQKVLVPQLYVRIKAGDLDGTGALLAGKEINLNLNGDLTNTGTIAGRNVVRLTADNVSNLGGRISGDAVAIAAKTDLNNIGGTIAAQSQLLATAGRDLNVVTTTQSTANRAAGGMGASNFSRTGVDRVAGLYVTGGASNTPGVLVASAGRDINLTAAVVANTTPGGSTFLAADRNVNLGTVTTGRSDNSVLNSTNHLKQSQSAEVGSQIIGLGDIRISAGQDINARAASVQAQGALSAVAGNNINLTAGQNTESFDEARQSVHKGALSKTTNTRRDVIDTTTAVGSSFEGQSVLLKSGKDINIAGSAVNAQQALIVDAKRDVNITAAQDTRSESHFSQSTREATGLAKGLATAIAVANPLSALTPNSGEQVAIAALLTRKNQASDQTAASTTAVGSQLTGGSLSVQSGRDTRVEGSAVVADGDISVKAGRNLLVTTAENTQADQSKTTDKTTGLLRFEATGNSVGKREQMQDQQSTEVTHTASQIVSLGQGGADGKSGNINLQAAGNTTITGSQVMAPGGDITISGANVLINEAQNTTTQASQTRFKETAASVQLKSGYVDAVKGAAKSVETARTAKQDTGSNRMAGLATLNAAASVYNAYQGVSGSAGASSASAAPISAISISGSIGQSKSQSDSTSAQTAAVGSTIAAGNSLSIVANGDKAAGNGNLTMIGTNASAGKEATLDAAGDLNLLASANTATSRSTNSGSNASLGATFALGGAQNGLSFQAGAQGSKGKANGDEVSFNNTTVTVGTAQTPGTLNLNSGGNATLKGATANADTINADIKGNLAIESLQDKAIYDSKQTSAGAGVSICIPPICYGTMVAVNVNASKTKADSSLKSVTDQSGLMAGDGGFSVKVGGNTQLTGGLLASSDQAIKDGKNSLITATLTTRDLDNYAEASASSTGFSASSSMASEGMYGAAKAVVSNALNNADTSGSSSGQTRSAISGGTITITNEAAQQALTGKTGEQTVTALNRDTAHAHTGATAPDVKAMEKKVEAERAITQATVAEALKFTDETYRKLFVEKHPMYEVMKDNDGKTILDEKTGRPILRELSEQEKTNLQPGSDGKVHISTNGIFNDKNAAGTYADQHNTTTGPQYVIYFPEANNVVSELLVAGYQKYMESNIMGLSNSTVQVRDAMNQYGQTGLQLDGHSRGAMTIGNGLESQAASPNAQGSLSNTTINFFGPAYNAQQADNLLSTLQDRANLPAAQQPGAIVQFQNHAADPVGGFIGRNPGTGGTIPNDSSTPVEAIRAGTGQPTTVHNCYGENSPASCRQFWKNLPEGLPRLQPATPVQVNRKAAQ